ncbi:hypothetical protein CWE12_07305 [Aliidiomarina sedimenti]|uniref:Uncharacterized protein n=1 Tax=Aliidiomarina sedimenti TaxID=1933879 RepID=A0ABY0BZ15_9GAMM|nr:hypothetical protein [Aliidiomarina sedimenti]RUO29771.1 hypothetical protein CWE12_07305 [Aliidiomarina sedimenti]
MAQTWVSRDYVVELERQCIEGDVACDAYEVVFTDKKRGTRSTMYGRTLHTVCARPGARCGLMGYQFSDAELRYRLYENGTLEIYDRGNRMLETERGDWHSRPPRVRRL